LSVLSGASNSGHIYFGDANDNDVGGVSYDHSQDSMTFRTSGSNNMTLDAQGNLTIGGILNQSEDRYFLDEYFHALPNKDIVDTEVSQDTSATTAVISHTKITRITTQAVDLAATDSVEFTLTNNMIHSNSHVIAYLINTSGVVADNAVVNAMIHDVADGSCKIRLATNATDIASQTFEIEVVVDSHIQANAHWALNGTNSTETQILYGGDKPGIRFYTTGADNDQVIIYPKKSNQGNNTSFLNVTPWRNVDFHSQYETELNIAIATNADITDVAIWAGLKLSEVGAYATDADQAYFLYATDDDMGALTTNGNLHFVYSVGGTDYITDLGITVATTTIYRLRLAFDENRKLSVFVNGVQYGLVTSATAGGATQTNSTQKSLAMTSGTSLLPIIGLQNLSAEARISYLHFIKISRALS